MDYISGGRVSMAIHRCRKPTIAAIQGPAVGVGLFVDLSRLAGLKLCTDWNHDDFAYDHSHRLRKSQSRLCLFPARSCHGSCFKLLPPETYRSFESLV